MQQLLPLLVCSTSKLNGADNCKTKTQKMRLSTRDAELMAATKETRLQKGNNVLILLKMRSQKYF